MKRILAYIIKFINLQKIKIKVKSIKVKSIIPLNLKIGEFVVIDKNVEIEKGIETIGDGTFIGKGTYINHCKNIGKYCSIARNVAIGIGNHPIDRISTSPLFYNSYRGLIKETTYNFKIADKKVIIGNDVWIGYNAILLDGVKVGDGSIIAAGAVVREDVEPYSIVGGVPAKKIGMRFSNETVMKMIESDISSLPIEIMYSNIDNICEIDKFINKISKFY